MFVGAGEKTYQGMIIGENSRWDDLDVNPMKAKQLNNIRAAPAGPTGCDAAGDDPDAHPGSGRADHGARHTADPAARR